jgi:hypothetical protein
MLVGVVSLHLDFMGVVGDELESGALGVEDLAAAGDEARSV